MQQRIRCSSRIYGKLGRGVEFEPFPVIKIQNDWLKNDVLAENFKSSRTNNNKIVVLESARHHDQEYSYFIPFCKNTTNTQQQQQNKKK